MLAIDGTSDWTDSLEAAIGAAQDAFSCCNWRHDRADSTSEEPSYCEGGGAECAYCQAADAAATKCHDLGEQAIDLLRAGAYRDAEELCEEARAAENAYGDCPAWQPVATIFEKFFEQHISLDDDSYDCHAADSGWRHYLYFDPTERRISLHRQYGNGTTAAVFHKCALLLRLPENAVGEHVRDVLESPDFGRLIRELCALYEGTEWDGNNYVGRWADDEKKHALEDQIEELFAEILTYWNATDWLSPVWNAGEAANVRKRLAGGESLDDVAEAMIDDARKNDFYLDQGELVNVLQELLGSHP